MVDVHHSDIYRRNWHRCVRENKIKMKGRREGGQEERTGGREGKNREGGKNYFKRKDFRYPDVKLIPPDITEILPSSDLNDFNVLSIV